MVACCSARCVSKYLLVEEAGGRGGAVLSLADDGPNLHLVLASMDIHHTGIGLGCDNPFPKGKARVSLTILPPEVMQLAVIGILYS